MSMEAHMTASEFGFVALSFVAVARFVISSASPSKHSLKNRASSLRAQHPNSVLQFDKRLRQMMDLKASASGHAAVDLSSKRRHRRHVRKSTNLGAGCLIKMSDPPKSKVRRFFEYVTSQPEPSDVSNFIKNAVLKICLGYGVLFIFLLIGGFVFNVVERDDELRRNAAKSDLLLKLNGCRAYFQGLATKVNSSSNGLVMVTRNDVERGTANCDVINSAFDIERATAPTHYWTVPGSSFFLYTTITTIGYGTYAPASTVGRGLVILFACLGIPLAGYVLQLLIQPMNSALCYMIQKYDPYRGPQWNTAVVGLLLLLILVLSGIAYWRLEGWDYATAMYFVFITLTTIGFGDFAPSKPSSYYFSFVFVTLGLATCATLLSTIATLMTEEAWQSVAKVSPSDEEMRAKERAASGGVEGGAGVLGNHGPDPIAQLSARGRKCPRCQGSGVVPTTLADVTTAPRILPLVMAGRTLQTAPTGVAVQRDRNRDAGEALPPGTTAQ